MYRNVWDHVLMTQCDVHWSDFLFCGNPIFASEILTGCWPNPMFPWATNPHAKCWQYLIQILCHSNSVGILHPNICWLHQSLFLWMESQCRRVKILKSHVCWHVLKSFLGSKPISKPLSNPCDIPMRWKKVVAAWNPISPNGFSWILSWYIMIYHIILPQLTKKIGYFNQLTQ